MLNTLFITVFLMCFGHGGQYQAPTASTLGGQGDLTVSPEARKAGVSWEEWWARNRFRYLRFPELEENVAAVFPVSPGNENAQRVDRALQACREETLFSARLLVRHQAFQIRGAAVLALGMLDDDASFPLILEMLQDPSPAVKDSAVRSLAFLNAPRAKHLLLHVARGTEDACKALKQSGVPDHLRGFALLALAMDGARGIGPELKSLAGDPGISVTLRAMAIESLGLLGGEDAARFLIDSSLDRRADPRLASTTVVALGRTDAVTVLPVLWKHLGARSMEVRCAAVQALARHVDQGDEEAIKRVHRAYRHSADAQFKGLCLLTMARISGPAALERLWNAAKFTEPDTVPWAYLALGISLRDYDHPDALDFLLQRITSRAHRPARTAAALALGLSGHDGAVTALSKALQEGESPYLRSYSALALGIIDDPRAIPPLRKAFDSDTMAPVRIQAGTALALLHDGSAVDDLFNFLLTTPDITNKAFTTLNLGCMADLRAAKLAARSLMEDLEDLDPQTVACCLQLNARLLSGRVLPFLEPLAADSSLHEALKNSVMGN